MAHIPEGTLRRFLDEPMAIADVHADHVRGCARCRHRGEQIETDAAKAFALLSRPLMLPDVDDAWKKLQRGLTEPPTTSRSFGQHGENRVRRHLLVPLPSKRALAGAATLAVAGTAALLVVTVLAPPRPAPAPSSPNDLESIADITGIGGSGVLGGFSSPTGELRLPFGVVTWASTGHSYRVGSIAEANTVTGLDIRLPSSLPGGVGSPGGILVQPEVRATISFSSSAGHSLDGTSLTIDAGPAVLVQFGSSDAKLGLPTLATFAMKMPTTSSSVAKTAELEAYVLSRPGLPTGLAQEIRLLGDLRTSLPLPELAGTDVTQVDVTGSPGLLVTDGSVGASAVIWEGHDDTVHAALGLLDRKDILNVADQLG